MKTQDIIKFKEQNKSAYFFKPATSASARRYNESKKSFDISAIYNGVEIQVVSQWYESCSIVRFAFTVYVDGIKKDLRYLKKLPAELEFN